MDRGRDVLRLWKLAGFEAVPADFAQTLAASLEALPRPVAQQ
jgi:hypothetical protein